MGCTAKAEQKKDNVIARIIREYKWLTTAKEETSSLALQIKSLQVKPNEKSKSDTNDQHSRKNKTNIKKIEELKKKRLYNYCQDIGIESVRNDLQIVKATKRSEMKRRKRHLGRRYFDVLLRNNRWWQICMISRFGCYAHDFPTWFFPWAETCGNGTFDKSREK